MLLLVQYEWNLLVFGGTCCKNYWDINWIGELYVKMSRTNDKCHMGLKPDEIAWRELEILMANLWERLKALRFGMGGETRVGKMKPIPQ